MKREKEVRQKGQYLFIYFLIYFAATKGEKGIIKGKQSICFIGFATTTIKGLRTNRKEQDERQKPLIRRERRRAVKKGIMQIEVDGNGRGLQEKENKER